MLIDKKDWKEKIGTNVYIRMEKERRRRLFVPQ